MIEDSEWVSRMIPLIPSNRNSTSVLQQNTVLPITVIVLTLNEEENIKACLESICAWTKEIILVDSGSKDHTLSIATEFTSKIYSHEFINYAQQRNWAQNHIDITQPWVLHVDADERVTPELRMAIEVFFASGQAQHYNGAIFSRRTMFMGRWIKHGGHYPVYHARLFRRDKGHCEERLYDQHFLVEPPVLRLDGDLIDILTSDLDTWSRRHIRWAGLEAAETQQKADVAGQVTARLWGTPIERRRWLRKVLFGRFPPFTRAFGYFIYRYLLRLGFLDGVEGLIFHFLQACWFRFYVDAKIWEMRRQSD